MAGNVRFDGDSSYADSGKSTYYPGHDGREAAQVLGLKSDSARDALNDISEMTGRKLFNSIDDAKASICGADGKGGSIATLVANGVISQEDANGIIAAMNDVHDTSEDGRWRMALYAEYLNSLAEMSATDPDAAIRYVGTYNDGDFVNLYNDAYADTSMNQDAGIGGITTPVMMLNEVRTYNEKDSIAAVQGLANALNNKEIDMDQFNVLFGNKDHVTDLSVLDNIGLQSQTQSLFEGIDLANPTPEQTVALTYLKMLDDQDTSATNMQGQSVSRNGETVYYDNVTISGEEWSALATAMKSNDLEAINDVLLPHLQTDMVGVTPEMVENYAATLEANRAAEEQAAKEAEEQAAKDAEEAELHQEAVNSYSGGLLSACQGLNAVTKDGIEIDGEQFSLSEFAKMNGVDPNSIPWHTTDQWNSELLNAVKDELQSQIDEAVIENDTLADLVNNSGASNMLEQNELVASVLGLDPAEVSGKMNTAFAYGYANQINPDTGEKYTYVEFLQKEYGDEYAELHDALTEAYEAEMETEEPDASDAEQPGNSDDNQPDAGDAEQPGNSNNDQPDAGDDDQDYVDGEEMGDDKGDDSAPNYEAGEFDQRAADMAMFAYMTAHDGVFGNGAQRVENFEAYCVENGYPYTAEDFGEIQGMVNDLINEYNWDYSKMPGWTDYQISLGKAVDLDSSDYTDADEMTDDQEEANSAQNEEDADYTDFQENGAESQAEGEETVVDMGEELGAVITIGGLEVNADNTLVSEENAANGYQLAQAIAGVKPEEIAQMIQDPALAHDVFPEKDMGDFAASYFEAINTQLANTGHEYSDADYALAAANVQGSALAYMDTYDNIQTVQVQNDGAGVY